MHNNHSNAEFDFRVTDPFPSLDTRQQRIELISQVLMEIAGGNFEQIAPISDHFDEIDAIASGVNMLSEELRETVISRNYLDSVLRSIVDMLFIFDEQFVIQQVTPKVCELLKTNENNLVEYPINVLFDGRKKRFLQRIKASLREKEILYNITTSFKMANKEKLPVTISFFTLKNNQNKTTGYLMIADDVKEKILMSNALKQRNEELKTLIYKTSHDLKGPLASMLGLFNLLETEKQDILTLQCYLSHLKNSALKLNNTIKGLLEVGMVDQGELTEQAFSMYHTIQSVVSSLDNFPGREEVDIKIQVDKKLEITSQENFIRSILQNLIENSIKYRQLNRKGPAIVSIIVRSQKDRILLTVKDNGQGMDKNVMKKAFDMFYRGNESSKGSGLGLFIVKSNVEKLGGQIKIRSKSNEGTEIKIYLPIER